MNPSAPTRRHRRRLAVALSVVALTAAACGSDEDEATDTTAAADTTEAAADDTATTEAGVETTAAGETPVEGDGVTAEGISDERCAANEAAGKIVYLSSFDYAAAASIIDVIVASEMGYFEAMCLDVELKPSFSTSNYPLVAAGEAQFSSAGSFTEILNYSVDGASFVALADYGKTPIEALVVKDPAVTDLASLEGATIGVKGDIPPSIVALLNSAGLTRGTSYQEVLLDGFDPVAHLATDIAAVPVYKSNEPGQLDAAGVEYALFDPTELGIPGSFGLLYTSPDFLAEHPTAAQDFIRASLKGMEATIADPEAAVAMAVALIDAAGNPNYLSAEGEGFRLTAELAEVMAGTPDGPVGLIDPSVFEAEVAAYVDAGVLAEAPASLESFYDASVAEGVIGDDGAVIFPAG